MLRISCFVFWKPYKNLTDILSETQWFRCYSAKMSKLSLKHCLFSAIMFEMYTFLPHTFSSCFWVQLLERQHNLFWKIIRKYYFNFVTSQMVFLPSFTCLQIIPLLCRSFDSYLLNRLNSNKKQNNAKVSFVQCIHVHCLWHSNMLSLAIHQRQQHCILLLLKKSLYEQWIFQNVKKVLQRFGLPNYSKLISFEKVVQNDGYDSARFLFVDRCTCGI